MCYNRMNIELKLETILEPVKHNDGTQFLRYLVRALRDSTNLGHYLPLNILKKIMRQVHCRMYVCTYSNVAIFGQVCSL